MILVSGNPLLEKSEYVEQRQNAGEDKNNVNTSETRGLEAQRSVQAPTETILERILMLFFDRIYTKMIYLLVRGFI